MVGQFQRRPNRNKRLNWKYAFFGNVQAVLGLFGCIFWTNKLNQKLHCNDAYHVRFRAFLLFFSFFWWICWQVFIKCYPNTPSNFIEPNANQNAPGAVQAILGACKLHWIECTLYSFFALFWLFTSHFNYSFQTLARLVKIGAPFSQEFGVPCWVCEPVLSPSLSWPDLKHTFGQPSFEKKTTSWN